MTSEKLPPPPTGPGMIRYANLLLSGTWYGLLLLLIGYLLYVSGIRASDLSPEQLSAYWSLSASEYVREAHVPTGLQWVGRLHRGDFLSFPALALLLSLPAGCLLAVVPSCVRKKDWLLLGALLLHLLILYIVASTRIAAQE